MSIKNFVTPWPDRKQGRFLTECDVQYPMQRVLDGLVANSGVGRTTGENWPSFQAPLIFRRPKQSDSSRFCSHTVQAPAKPKPLRNHSMASNPRIVRHAVWED